MLKLFGLVLCVAAAVAVPLVKDKGAAPLVDDKVTVQLVDDKVAVPQKEDKLAVPLLDNDIDEFNSNSTLFPCRFDSPDLEKCIEEGVKMLVPKLRNGSKALGIPPTDPYEMDPISLKLEFGKILYGSGRSHGVRVFGHNKDQYIKDLKINVTGNHIKAEAKYFNPKVRAEGYYQGVGRFNGLKLDSKGYFNSTATNISGVAKAEGEIVDINGEKYFQLLKVDGIPNIGDQKTYATGIFSNPSLNRLALNYGNRNWRVMYRVLLPQMKKQLESLAIAKVNEYLLRIPLSKIFRSDTDAA